jgi:hypothetical protein
MIKKDNKIIALKMSYRLKSSLYYQRRQEWKEEKN